MGLFSSIFNRAGKTGKSDPSTAALEYSGPDGNEKLLAAALAAKAANHREDALDLLDRGVQLFPEDASIRRERHALEVEFAREAISKLNARLASDGTAEVRAELSELYRRTGERDKAVQLGRSAIEADSSAACGYRAVGRVYFDQFRATENSIHGMHALRYLSKAHSLAPSNSMCILKLAEIFVILRAPSAAKRFLAPVQKAFEDDPLVQDLARRIAELPPENTTQIQDLFLRHERRQSGESAPTASPAQITADARERFEEWVATTPGVQGACFVGGDRTVLHSAGNPAWSNDDVGERLGLLGETLRSSSVRMGIGEFKRLIATYPEQTLAVDPHGPGLDLFLIGDDSLQSQQIEPLLDRLAKKIDLGREVVER